MTKLALLIVASFLCKISLTCASHDQFYRGNGQYSCNMKSFQVTPSNQNQIVALTDFVNSPSSPHYYVRGGSIEVGQPTEILFPIELEDEFLRRIHSHGAGLRAVVHHRRIKLKTYKTSARTPVHQDQHFLAQGNCKTEGPCGGTSGITCCPPKRCTAPLYSGNYACGD